MVIIAKFLQLNNKISHTNGSIQSHIKGEKDFTFNRYGISKRLMTIKDNLLLAKKDATDDEIKSAIEKASLGEFVSTLKKGVLTKVGESGIKLSGG